jgi:hypothetical protein
MEQQQIVSYPFSSNTDQVEDIRNPFTKESLCQVNLTTYKNSKGEWKMFSIVEFQSGDVSAKKEFSETNFDELFKKVKGFLLKLP